MVSREDVIGAYRLILGRDPESEIAIQDKLPFKTSSGLCNALLHCEEYRSKSQDKKMHIQSNIAELPALFSLVEAAWEAMGKSEPFHSVLTNSKYLNKNIDKSAFYDTGKLDVDNIINELERHDIDCHKLKSCLEYGCGVGRMTGRFAERFNIVHAYDISLQHLEIAKHHLKNIKNVELHHVRDLHALDALHKVDFICSLIVLQHSPPPMIEYILHRLFRCLNPGGIAYFQLPIYIPGYGFNSTEYLAMPWHDMEMHALPQRWVFQIASREKCTPVAVWEDGWAADYGTSNTFIITK